MGRKRFDQMSCSVAQALEVLGDWWTLLIVREAFFGTRRFSDFSRHLGLAKNTLSDRLSHLVENGILERVDSGKTGTRYEYRLTAKGHDLLPVLTALRQWSDEWVYGEGAEPTIVRDRATGRRLPKMVPRDVEGRELSSRDLFAEPGPGADDELRQRFEVAWRRRIERRAQAG
ncbi:MAG: helix-turn-helix transcriptional regulator [Thermoanaerobaculia bacterium]|nr:helix-turn-helix transcriptional regulator [Thermoanaerobaculia bacterium]